jgi:hypothetical protein
MRQQRERPGRIAVPGAIPLAYRAPTQRATVDERVLIQPTPLPDITTLDPNLEWSKYALKSIEFLGIGWWEVVAAVRDPERSTTKSDDASKDVRIRGDVRVIYVPAENLITNVGNRNSTKEKAYIRKPLHPPIPEREEETMPAIGNAIDPRVKAVITAPTFTQPQDPPEATPKTIAKRAPKARPMNARTAFEDVLAGLPAGASITLGYVFEQREANLMAHYEDERTARNNLGTVGSSLIRSGELKKAEGARNGYIKPRKPKPQEPEPDYRTTTLERRAPTREAPTREIPEPRQATPAQAPPEQPMPEHTPLPFTAEDEPVSTPPAQQQPEQPLDDVLPPAHVLVPVKKPAEGQLIEPWMLPVQPDPNAIRDVLYRLLPAIEQSGLSYSTHRSNGEWHFEVGTVPPEKTEQNGKH